MPSFDPPATLFISDLHLSVEQPQIGTQFMEFLRGPARQAEALYILGDLFEYWAGDDDLTDPHAIQICAALKACSQRTPVFFLAGNRDFLIGTGFAGASGVQLLAEPTLIELYGRPVLLLHGDTLCTDDLAYQAFRATARSAGWQADFLARPLDERKARILALRELSQAEKQEKSAAIMDVHPQTVAETFRQYGYPMMIHGHTHRLRHHQHAVDSHPCERWVLGDWERQGNYLLIDAQGGRFHYLPHAA